MSKRKKNKHHAKNKRGANGTIESANATEVLADASASDADTSAVEPAEPETVADSGQDIESPTEPELEAVTVDQNAPSELTSDQRETEVEADASNVAEEPEADADRHASGEPAAESTKGKSKSKSKKGKETSASEASHPEDTTDQAPVSKNAPVSEPTPPPDTEQESTAVESDPEVAAPETPADKAKRKKGKKAAKGEAATATGDDVTIEDESAGRPAPEAGDAEDAAGSSDESFATEMDSGQDANDAGEAAADADEDTSPDVTTEADGAIEASAAESGNEKAVEGETSNTPANGNLLEGDRLESIIESLLFASDKALSLADLKRLLGDRDGKKINAAVQSLIQKRMDSGIHVVTLSTGWHLRTSVDNAEWVSKLLVGKPVRLSRAMMETLAIVAYRQPVTRPEIDDIRGVDCGPVLKTLLDRGLVRIIGKKEEVGRPMLYGTTQEFLRVFNLRDLTELPTLREFYDLSAEDQSKVDAEAPQTPSATTAKPEVALNSVARGALAPEEEDTDPLLDELDEASKLAKKALGEMEPEKQEEQAEESQPATAAPNEPESTPAGE